MKTLIDKKRYYTDNNGTYYDRCREAHRATGQRCTICLGKSQEVHHTAYGEDVIGFTIFPVCKACHSICHTVGNWIEDTDKMKSHNTDKFTDYLRMRFLFVGIVHNPAHGQLNYKSKKHKRKKQ